MCVHVVCVCVLLLFWRDSFFMIFLISAYPMIRDNDSFCFRLFLKYVYILNSLGKKGSVTLWGKGCTGLLTACFKGLESLRFNVRLPGGSVVKIHLPRRKPRFDSWPGKIPWRRKWQPTPIFLPGKSHGQSCRVGNSPWGLGESDTT